MKTSPKVNGIPSADEYDESSDEDEEKKDVPEASVNGMVGNVDIDNDNSEDNEWCKVSKTGD